MALTRLVVLVGLWACVVAATGALGQSSSQSPAREQAARSIALFREAGSAEACEREQPVGWAWASGGKRTPVPGTQAEFGALMRAWFESGAVCPAE